MRRNRKRGFTRVDALVTIMVIAMIVTTLSAALVPAMNKAREAAMRARCANQMKQISAAIAIYADAYDNWLPWYGGKDPNYPSPFNGTPPSDESHPYVAYRGDNPNYLDVNGAPIPMRLACLYEADIINDARIFYCPVNIEEQYQYESYINPAPWGTLPQVFNTKECMSQWVRSGYTYYPVDETVPMYYNGELLAPKWTARRFDKLEPNIPYLADIIWYRATMSHKTEGSYSLNALFKDGHVVYCKDRRIFSDDPADDPQRLWPQWETRTIDFSHFYYNFLKKIGP